MNIRELAVEMKIPERRLTLSEISAAGKGFSEHGNGESEK